MRIPDFFVVGAPKCGTSAIYSYLREHPSIFMPENKEPHHFCRDLAPRHRIESETEYLRLFVDAPPHTSIGDASTSYLLSRVAVKEIIQRNPKARMIAGLRNPIDMAYALHRQMLNTLNEDVEDFEVAWSLQGERRRGRRVPESCDKIIALLYREHCSFSGQIRRFFDFVPAEQRLVYIFEEFVTNPRETHTRILDFLGIPDDGRSEFPQVNASKALRSRRLALWTGSLRKRMGRWYEPMRAAASTVGNPQSILRHWNLKMQPRAPLSNGFRRQLAEELMPDVRELESLLGRRLDCWADFSETTDRQPRTGIPL